MKTKHKEIDFQNEDEFSVDDLVEPENNTKVKDMKPMMAVYQELAKNTNKPKKQKKIAKQQIKVENDLKQTKKSEKKKKNIDPTFKYIKNQALENELKSKALQGVLKIMNLISKQQKLQNS